VEYIVLPGLFTILLCVLYPSVALFFAGSVLFAAALYLAVIGGVAVLQATATLAVGGFLCLGFAAVVSQLRKINDRLESLNRSTASASLSSPPTSSMPLANFEPMKPPSESPPAESLADALAKQWAPVAATESKESQDAARSPEAGFSKPSQANPSTTHVGAISPATADPRLNALDAQIAAAREGKQTR
jgi:hypothetical protein